MLPFLFPELNPRLELGMRCIPLGLIFTFPLNLPLKKGDFGGPSFMTSIYILKNKRIVLVTILSFSKS